MRQGIGYQPDERRLRWSHAIAGRLGVPEPQGEQLARLVAAVAIEDLQLERRHAALDALDERAPRWQLLDERTPEGGARILLVLHPGQQLADCHAHAGDGLP